MAIPDNNGPYRLLAEKSLLTKDKKRLVKKSITKKQNSRKKK